MYIAIKDIAVVSHVFRVLYTRLVYSQSRVTDTCLLHTACTCSLRIAMIYKRQQSSTTHAQNCVPCTGRLRVSLLVCCNYNDNLRTSKTAEIRVKVM